MSQKAENRLAKNRFAVNRRMNAEPSAPERPRHSWILRDGGWRRPCRSSRVTRRRRWPLTSRCTHPTLRGSGCVVQHRSWNVMHYLAALAEG